MCYQNKYVAKKEAAVQATSRRALTTFLPVLEAGQRVGMTVAIVHAALDRHTYRVREHESERGLLGVVVPYAIKCQTVGPIREARWWETYVEQKSPAHPGGSIMEGTN